MRHPDHLKKMFETVRKAVTIPFTMKMRSGWDEDSKNCLEIAHIAEGSGLDGITIHGRTRAQMYRGEADWSYVEQVADAVKIPVCGSGDIVSPETATKRLASGKVAGLFIGRAAIEDPYVFSDITGDPGLLNSKGKRLTPFEILTRYNELLVEECSTKKLSATFDRDRINIGKLKQMASQLGKNAPWVKPFCRALKLSEQLEILEKFRIEAEES